LIDKITNGSKIEIDVVGTKLFFKPGMLTGGKIKHDCPNSRSIGYYLEALILLAPFGKEPLNIVLNGITNHMDNLDISVDTFRTVTIPTLKHIGVTENISFKITKRGAAPLGGGSVTFVCHPVKQLDALELIDEGKIKRIRGIAFTTRASPSFGNRMIEDTKTALNKYSNDVFIYKDHYKANESGPSPGFGLTLVAETTTDCFISVEMMAEKDTLPEELSSMCTNSLIHEILRGGCVDTSNQGILVMLMALGPEDLAKLKIGKLSPYTIELLRNINIFFAVKFQITPDPATKTILLSCFGCGYSNITRRLL